MKDMSLFMEKTGVRFIRAAIAGVLAAVSLPHTLAAATTNDWYGPAYSSWPTNWVAIPSLNDPLNSAILPQLDFVGDTANPGAYWAENKDYVFFRIRVAVSSVSSTTFRDSHWIYIDRIGFTNGTSPVDAPDYAVSWDSKSNDTTKHGEEIQTGTNLAAITSWEGVAMPDIDNNAGTKTAPPDINTSGDGFVRTVDAQATANFGNTTFIDFALSWAYLSANTAMGRGQEWRVQFGSRRDSTDHNAPSADIAGGYAPGSLVTASWSHVIGITSTEPTTQATNLLFSAIGATNMTVSWKDGNGANRIVVASTNPASWAPTDGAGYAANSNLSLAADQGGGHKVIYDGSGTNVTVTGLSPDVNYHFSVYEYNGSSSTANYFTGNAVTGNQETLATLQIISAHGVPVPAGGTYAHAKNTILTNNCSDLETAGGIQYTNAGWSMAGNSPLSGGTTNFTMTLTNNAVLTWLWNTNYQLTANGGPHGTVTGTANGWHAQGSSATVTGEPDTGCHFAGWSGNTQGDTNNATMNLTMDQARSVTANFAINIYTLAYSAGAGTLTGTSPQTVDYNTSGSAVTANPPTGYHFTKWSDDVTANPRTDASVKANVSVTAQYAINTYTLAYDVGAGTLTGTSPQTVDYNTSGSAVTANPPTGYHFTKWSDDVTANPRTDASVKANVSVSAQYAINTYTLTVVSTRGTASPAVGGHSYAYNTALTPSVTVPGADGATRYVCTGWTLNGNAPAGGAGTSASFTLTNSATLTWTWKTQHQLAMTTHGLGTVDGAVDGAWYDAGTDLNLETVPGTGWAFMGWVGDLSGSQMTTLTMDGPKTIAAFFGLVNGPTVISFQ